eukprot:COSAG01_NODE_797_length_13523_cov_34.143027_10_plen_103_part_00
MCVGYALGRTARVRVVERWGRPKAVSVDWIDRACFIVADDAICTKYNIEEGFLVLHKLVKVGGADPENEAALATEDEQRERDREAAEKKAKEEASASSAAAA